MANKVRYGLKNVYYATLTITGGVPSYGTPVAMPGAVSLELSPEGDTYTKYADNTAYFVKALNNGYSGTMELTVLPDTFRTSVLGEQTSTTNSILYETSDITTTPFALLFQFEGDDKATRYALYNCIAQRPGINGATLEDSMEVQDESLDLTVSPILHGTENIIKGRALYGDTAYASWFSAVTLPS